MRHLAMACTVMSCALGSALVADTLELSPGKGLDCRLIHDPKYGRTVTDGKIALRTTKQENEGPSKLLIAFDLDELPPASKVAKAEMKAAVVGRLGDETVVTIRQPKRAWDPRASWTEFAAGKRWQKAGAAGVKDLARDAVAKGKEGAFDLTELIQALAYRQRSNRGLLAQAEGNGPAFQEWDLSTLRLTITYSPPGPEFVPSQPKITTDAIVGVDASMKFAWAGGPPAERIPGARYWYEVEYHIPAAAEEVAEEELRRKAEAEAKKREAEREQALEKEMEAEDDLEDGPGEADPIDKVKLPEPKLPVEKAEGEKKIERRAVKSGWHPVGRQFATDHQGTRVDVRDLPSADGYRLRVRINSSCGLTGSWAESGPVSITEKSFVIWATDSLVKERPVARTYLRPMKVELAAARNEYEPFQLFVSAGMHGVGEVHLRVTSLTGPKGTIPSWEIEPYREIWVNRTWGEEGNPYDPPQFWPDPLVPFWDRYNGGPLGGRCNPNPVDCPPGGLIGYWVDIYVPASTNAGVYKGEAVLDFEDRDSVSVPIELEVWDFTVPRERSIGTLWSLVGNSGYGALYERFVKELHRHRLDAYGARVAPSVKVKDGKLLEVDWDRYDRVARRFIDGSLFEDGVPMKQLAVSPWYGHQDVPREVNWYYASRGREADDALADLFSEYLRRFRTHLMDLGGLDSVWYYTDDEPGNYINILCCWNYVASHLRKAIPEMRRHITSVQLDYCEGHISMYDVNPDWMYKMRRTGFQALRRKYGDKFYMYNGFSYVVTPALSQRMLGWYAWNSDADGWLCWASCFGWSPDPWSLLHSWSGDGVFLYPGSPEAVGTKDYIPCPNIELKLTRETMEDYEYLKLAEAAVGREKVEETTGLVATTVSGPYKLKNRRGHRHYGVGYTNDPPTFRRVRRQIAETILANKPRDGALGKSAEELLREGNVALAKGDTRTALARAKDALFVNRGSLQAGRLEVECLLRQNMPTEALESALRLVRRNADSGEAFQTLGDTYDWMQRYDEACEAYEKSLAKGLSEGEAVRIRGFLAENRFPQDGSVAFRLKVPAFRNFGSEEGITRGMGRWGGIETAPSNPSGKPCLLLKPDIGKMPRGRVVRAHLVYKFTYNPESKRFWPVYTAFPLLADWDPATVSWYQRARGKPWGEPGAGKPGTDRGEIRSPAGMSQWEVQGRAGTLRIDVTGLVRNWLSGKVPYHGMAVSLSSGGVSPTGGEMVVWYVPDPEAPKAVVPLVAQLPVKKPAEAAPQPASSQPAPPPPPPARKAPGSQAPDKQFGPPGPGLDHIEEDIDLGRDAGNESDGELLVDGGEKAQKKKEAEKASREMDLYLLTKTESRKQMPKGGAGTWFYTADGRAAAAGRLGKYRDQEVVEVLLNAMFHDKNPHVRTNARRGVLSMAKADRKRFVPLFEKHIVESKGWGTRHSMAHLLFDIWCPESRAILIRLMKNDPSEDVRGPVAKLLAKRWDAEIEDALWGALKVEENTLVKCLAAWEFVRRHRAKVIPEFVDVLKTGQIWEGRWFALEAITYLKDHAKEGELPAIDAAVPALIGAALHDQSERVRFRAVDTLWHFDGDQVVRTLIEAMQKDADFEIRSHAAMILGEKGDPAAVPALVGALKDKNPWVRYYAAKSLGKLPTRDGLSALAKLEGDEKWWVEKAARASAQLISSALGATGAP